VLVSGQGQPEGCGGTSPALWDIRRRRQDRGQSMHGRLSMAASSTVAFASRS